MGFLLLVCSWGRSRQCVDRCLVAGGSAAALLLPCLGCLALDGLAGKAGSKRKHPPGQPGPPTLDRGERMEAPSSAPWLFPHSGGQPGWV